MVRTQQISSHVVSTRALRLCHEWGEDRMHHDANRSALHTEIVRTNYICQPCFAPYLPIAAYFYLLGKRNCASRFCGSEICKRYLQVYPLVVNGCLGTTCLYVTWGLDAAIEEVISRIWEWSWAPSTTTLCLPRHAMGQLKSSWSGEDPRGAMPRRVYML